MLCQVPQGASFAWPQSLLLLCEMQSLKNWANYFKVVCLWTFFIPWWVEEIIDICGNVKVTPWQIWYWVGQYQHSFRCSIGKVEYCACLHALLRDWEAYFPEKLGKFKPSKMWLPEQSPDSLGFKLFTIPYWKIHLVTWCDFR